MSFDENAETEHVIWKHGDVLKERLDWEGEALQEGTGEVPVSSFYRWETRSRNITMSPT